MATIAIKVGGVDLTANVVFATARFTAKVNGRPGEAYMRVRDLLSAYSFTEGADWVVLVDGEAAWRGYVTMITTAYVFPAENVTEPGLQRWFDLRGTDVNILFQRRVVNSMATPLSEGPQYPAGTADTTAITELVDNWLDIADDDLDVTSGVVGVATIDPAEAVYPWSSGWTWAQAMDSIAMLPAAIYYLRPEASSPRATFVYCDVETVTAPFGLSDTPNGTTTRGYRECEIVIDGTGMANDVLSIGFGYGSSTPVYSRLSDATSIATHGRWQQGQRKTGIYKQDTIDRVSESIVYGSPTNQRGAKDDQPYIRLATYEPGLLCGQVVSFTSAVFGWSDTIPIRESVLTFLGPDIPRWDLVLSHVIDAPWGFFDQYWPQSLVLPKPVPPGLPTLTTVSNVHQWGRIANTGELDPDVTVCDFLAGTWTISGPEPFTRLLTPTAGENWVAGTSTDQVPPSSPDMLMVKFTQTFPAITLSDRDEFVGQVTFPYVTVGAYSDVTFTMSLGNIGQGFAYWVYAPAYGKTGVYYTNKTLLDPPDYPAAGAYNYRIKIEGGGVFTKFWPVYYSEPASWYGPEFQSPPLVLDNVEIRFSMTAYNATGFPAGFTVSASLPKLCSTTFATTRTPTVIQNAADLSAGSDYEMTFTVTTRYVTGSTNMSLEVSASSDAETLKLDLGSKQLSLGGGGAISVANVGFLDNDYTWYPVYVGWTGSPATWQPLHTYGNGSLVVPTTPNGHIYAMYPGYDNQSSTTEPVWPTNGDYIDDGGMYWYDLGPTWNRLSVGGWHASWDYSAHEAWGTNTDIVTFISVLGQVFVAEAFAGMTTGTSQPSFTPLEWAGDLGINVRFKRDSGVLYAKLWSGLTEPSDWLLTQVVTPAAMSRLFFKASGMSAGQAFVRDIRLWVDGTELGSPFDSLDRPDTLSGWGTADYGTPWAVISEQQANLTSIMQLGTGTTTFVTGVGGYGCEVPKRLSSTSMRLSYPFLPNATMVFRNGLFQKRTVDYTENADNLGITLVTPLGADDTIFICYYVRAIQT